MRNRFNGFFQIFIPIIIFLFFMNITGFAIENTIGSYQVEYDENGNPYIADQLIIGYKKDTAEDSKKELQALIKAEKKIKLNGINADVLKVEKGKVKDSIRELKKNSKVLFAEPDYVAELDYTPNDPGYVGQTALPAMNVSGAWDYTRGISSVTIAVIDSGISSNNTDLKGNIVSGYNYVANSTNYIDDNGHGTMVASVAGAITDNSNGIAGIAGKCQLLAIKVADSTGAISYSGMINGIGYAVSNGAKVINMSLGGRTGSSALQLAIDNAVARNVTVVAAAGNEGTTSLSYPAAYPNVIGVGAVDTTGAKMSYSNTGAGLTIMANGTARVITLTGSLTSATGTSFSAPYVSGLAALMYSYNPNITPAQVMKLIGDGAKDLGIAGYDTTYGYGVVDMGKSMQMLAGGISTPTPTPTPTSTPTPTPTTTTSDTAPPVITLNGQTDVSIPQGGIYVDAGATAVDVVDGDVTSKITITGTVNTSTGGSYQLKYDVADKAGNKAVTKTRNVTVVGDTVPPEITLNGTADMSITQGTTYTDAGATAIDQVDGDITTKIMKTGTVDTSLAGSYQLYYDVFDKAGNKAVTKTRNVTVVADTVPPVITLNGAADLTVVQGFVYSEPGATALDQVDGDISTKIVITGSVNTSIPGSYELKYDVSDKAGNHAMTKIRTATVVASTEIVTIPTEQTVVVRDSQAITGDLSKKTTLSNTHILTVYNDGQLDISLLYSGRYLPKIGITGPNGNLDFAGTNGTYKVLKGTYTLTISSTSNTTYTLNITYPERIVSENTPGSGLTEIVIEKTNPLWYVYLATSLAVILLMAILLYRKRMNGKEVD